MEQGAKRKAEHTCKLNGCSKKVFVERKTGRVHDYCCKTHATTDKAASKESLHKSKHLKIEYEKTITNNNNENTNTKNEMASKEPGNWKEIWKLVKEAVPNSKLPSKLATKEERFARFVKYMLSGQTTDVQIDATSQLLEDNGLSVDMILNTSEEKLTSLLKGVNNAARKAKWIRKATKIIQEKYNGDIPGTYEELVSFSGVGPKIATMTMRYCWGENVGISVDVHIHRVCNRLGWVRSADDREKTKKEVEEWLPKELWGEFGMFYKFGQQVCTAMSPKCKECPLAQMCPSYLNK